MNEIEDRSGFENGAAGPFHEVQQNEIPDVLFDRLAFIPSNLPIASDKVDDSQENLPIAMNEVFRKQQSQQLAFFAVLDEFLHGFCLSRYGNCGTGRG